jgi:putative zinc finger protein
MGPHVTERLSAYMDEELGEADRAQVDAHLRGCPACARHLEELRAVDAAARALPLEVPDGYFEAFSGRVRRRLAPAGPRRRLYAPAWTFRVGAAAAAAVVLALLTPRLLRGPGAGVAVPTPSVPAAHAVPPAATVSGGAGAPAAPPPPAAAKTDARAADAAARPATRNEPAPRAGLGRRLEEQAPPQTPPPPAAAAAPTREHARDATGGAPASGYAAPPPAADELQKAPLETAPQAKMEAESGAAGREESKERRDKAALGPLLRDRAGSAPASDGRFQLLLRKTASSAAEARALRDSWRAFARDEATGPRADEARVRAVEAGAEAWRKGRDEKDRAEAQREGREYLERSDALQPDRVRAALKTLSP